MVKALEVAKYIVQEALHRDRPVSNLKLQKLLYFVQGVSLALNNVPAFDDKIVAWKYGPVVEDVYYAYSMYGANDIIIPFEVDLDLTEDLKDVIKLVLDELLKFSAIELVKETHVVGSPWSEATLNDIIPTDSIKKYFLEHYING